MGYKQHIRYELKTRYICRGLQLCLLLILVLWKFVVSLRGTDAFRLHLCSVECAVVPTGAPCCAFPLSLAQKHKQCSGQRGVTLAC